MTMDFSAFHFIRPAAFVALVPLAILGWYFFRKREAAGVWQSVCDDALLPYLLVSRATAQTRFKPLAFILCGLLAIVALAGPSWERLPTPVFRDESALVLLLDLSLSMNAADISPSRLERAKFKITDILRQRREGQTALIVYAGEPYVVTPLTSDVATIESHLPNLRPALMPAQGSATADAIAKGIDLLKQAGMTHGDLLLVTDGIDPAQAEKSSELVKASSVRLSILGVGTHEGAPIPDASGGFIKDGSGAIVVQSLNREDMRALSNSGGGRFESVRTDDEDVANLLNSMLAEVDQRNTESTDLFADQWREFGPWLLVAILPILPLAFRRGLLLVTLSTGLSLLSVAEPANAAWWKTPDQQGQTEFDQGNFDQAAALFDDRGWQAAANYRANDYEAVLESLPETAAPDGNYNKGNALARLGRFDEAIAAYDAAIGANPDHDDAKHNKALIEELLAEQQENQDSSSDSSDEDQEQDQSGQSGGDQAGEQTSDTPSDSESSDSAEQQPGEQEQDAANSSAEESSEAPAPEEEAEETAQEQEINEQNADAQSAEQASAQANSNMENEQATEQWLRQIPDDPGGLLRRKFEYEYQKKYGNAARRSGW